MTIKEIDAAIAEFVDGVIVDGDKYYYSVDEFVEHYIDEAADEEELPMTINGTWKQYFGFNSAESVADGLFEDVLYDFSRGGNWWYLHHNARQLADDSLESIYDNCDDLDMPYADVYGLDDLQSALDVFRAINQTWWLLGRWIKGFDPCKHSIGLKGLQRALDKAEMLNTHHFVYSYNPKQSVTLTLEWWLDVGWKPEGDTK